MALLQEHGIAPVIVDYLQTPPSAERLAGLLAAIGMAPRALLRDKEPQYAALCLGDPAGDAQLIALMV